MSIVLKKYHVNDEICSHIIIQRSSKVIDIQIPKDEKGLDIYVIEQTEVAFPEEVRVSFTGLELNQEFKPSGEYFKSIYYTNGRSVHIFLTYYPLKG